VTREADGQTRRNGDNIILELSRVGLAALVSRAQGFAATDATRYVWFLVAAAYVVVMAATASVLSWDIWPALVIVPVLAAVTLPLVRRGLRKDPDPLIGRIVVVAFVAKMLGSMARYALTYGLYDAGDAEQYHLSGGRLAAAFWDGTYARVAQVEVPDLTGTPFINQVTGILYIFTSPTKLGGFLIFAWLSFIGLFCFYKAVVVGFPAANHRTYAYLVFFLPSMLYWPSSIGKDAWICFGLGVSSYGIALIMRHRPLGYPVAGLGLLAISGARPHVTVLVVVSLSMAYLLRRKSWRDATLGPVGKVAGIVVLLGVGLIVVSKAASYFDVDNVSGDSVTEVLDSTDQRTGQGGSEFEAVRVKSPIEFPKAVLAVLFRPWPWEASSGQVLIASAEGIMLLVLGAAAATRLWRLPKYIFQVPYVAYAATYTVMFVIAFSSISNFGILTRQRTQVLPLVLVLLVLPRETHRMEEHAPTLENRARQLAQSPSPVRRHAPAAAGAAGATRELTPGPSARISLAPAPRRRGLQDGRMGLGEVDPGRERLLTHRSVGATLLAVVIFAIAMGFTWVNRGGDDSVDLAALPTRQTATGGDEASGRIPPSQPASPVSFTSSGGVVPVPVTVRIVDPETGRSVVRGTATTRPQGTATTRPGTGTSTTVPGGPSTTAPPTTQPPTTQPPTTQPPTTAPPTTQPPTTQGP
jgi:hypothetical protein